MNRLALLFLCLIFAACDDFGGKGSCIAFKEISKEKSVAVYALAQSGYETSDYWTDYSIEIFDTRTAKTIMTQTFTCDARNDKQKVLNIDENYTFLDAEKLTLVSNKNPKEILFYEDIIKKIEAMNPSLKGKVAELTVFSISFLRLIAKDGREYTIDMKTFLALEPKNPGSYYTEENLYFNLRQHIMPGDIRLYKGHSLISYHENYAINIETESGESGGSRAFLYKYDGVWIKPNDKDTVQKTASQNPNDISITVINNNSPYFQMNMTSRKKIYPEPFLLARTLGFANGAIYICYKSEMGKEGQYLLSKFNLSSQSIEWTLNVDEMREKQEQKNFSEVWSSDFDALYLLNFEGNKMLKIDALTGKILYLK